MRLADVRPGAAFDASPLSRVRPAPASATPVAVAPAVVIQGMAFVPVPGQRGLPGAAATTLPWDNITDKPALVYPADLEPSIDLTILFENGLA